MSTELEKQCTACGTDTAVRKSATINGVKFTSRDGVHFFKRLKPNENAEEFFAEKLRGQCVRTNFGSNVYEWAWFALTHKHCITYNRDSKKFMVRER